MHTDDAMSNLSYKALSNDKGEAENFNAAVRQNLTKISMGAATDKVVRIVHCMVYSRGPTPAGISYKLFGIPNGIWNLALESGILRLVEIQNSRNSPDISVNL